MRVSIKKYLYMVICLIPLVWGRDGFAEATHNDQGYVFTFLREYRFANDRQSEILNEPLRKISREIAALADIPYQEVSGGSLFEVEKKIQKNPNHLGFIVKGLNGQTDIKDLGTLVEFDINIYVHPDDNPPHTLQEAQALKRVAFWAAPEVNIFEKYKLDLVKISHGAGASILKLRKVNGFVANPFMLINRWHYMGYEGLPQKGVVLVTLPLVLAIYNDISHPDYEKIKAAYQTILASQKYTYLGDLMNTPEKYIHQGRIQF